MKRVVLKPILGRPKRAMPDEEDFTRRESPRKFLIARKEDL
jgi:hypothetical protein